MRPPWVLVSSARRLGIAGSSALACAAGAYAFHDQVEPSTWFLLVPVASLAAAVVAALLAPLWCQLVARAVQWSNLGVGMMMTLLGNQTERPRGCALACACGIALLVLGQHGLAEAERRASFVPAAFRNSLLLLMILAIADALSFALYGGVLMDAGGSGLGLPATILFLASFALCVGFVLLLRMSTVGLLVNGVASLAVLAFVCTPYDSGDQSIRWVLLVLAAVHLLVVTGVGVSMKRGRALLPLTPRSRHLATTTSIAALMATSVIAAMVRSS